MGNHLESLVAHIQIKVVLRYKRVKIYIKCNMLAIQEIHFVHGTVAYRHPFFKTGGPEPNFGSPGHKVSAFGAP